MPFPCWDYKRVLLYPAGAELLPFYPKPSCLVTLWLLRTLHQAQDKISKKNKIQKTKKPSVVGLKMGAGGPDTGGHIQLL